MRAMAPSVRIVALGDSLTVGFQPYGVSGDYGSSTPYTDVLTNRIAEGFHSQSRFVEVVNKGVNGDLTEQMLARFDADVIRLSSKIVIILGGSNDLGWGIPTREVFSNLCEMYALSLRKRVIPIACTIPSISGFDEGIPPRITLNELIRQYCSGRGLQCADLFSATTEKATKRLASQYSRDGLHLNTRGYEKIGDTIYDQALRPVLSTLFEDLRS